MMVAVKMTQNSGFRKKSKSDLLGFGLRYSVVLGRIHNRPQVVRISTATAQPTKVAL